jgi:hypothetical protein
MIGLVLAGLGYAATLLALPSGWKFLPQLLFNEGVTVLFAVLIIAAIAGKFRNNRGWVGLLAGVIVCFYVAGGISILTSG